MLTLEQKRDRMLKYMRMATQAYNSSMGINRDSPRTKQLQRIARKALMLYHKAMPVQTKKKRSKTSRKS